jgi:hypothetical protein
LPDTGNDRLSDQAKRTVAAGSAVSKKEREMVIVEDAAAVGWPRRASGAGGDRAVSGVDGEAHPHDLGCALLHARGLLPERGTATFLTVALAPAIYVREPPK